MSLVFKFYKLPFQRSTSWAFQLKNLCCPLMRSSPIFLGEKNTWKPPPSDMTMTPSFPILLIVFPKTSSPHSVCQVCQLFQDPSTWTKFKHFKIVLSRKHLSHQQYLQVFLVDASVGLQTEITNVDHGWTYIYNEFNIEKVV